MVTAWTLQAQTASTQRRLIPGMCPKRVLSIKGLTTWHYGAPVSCVDSVGGTGTVCMCSVVISGKTAVSDSVSDSSCGAADI